MQKRNNKLIKTMLLGSLAFVLMSSSRAFAQEVSVYKCTTNKGKIVYQDVGCAPTDRIEILNIRFNQSADIAPGLRVQENIAQEHAFQRQMLEISKRS